MTASVVPLAPAAGWQAADRARRFAALIALPLAALLALLVLSHPDRLPGLAVLGWLLIGPACCYSLARVLRPESVTGERTSRHLLASAAMAYAVPTLADMTSSDIGVQAIFGPPAFILGVATTIWGLAALVYRAMGRVSVA